MPKIIYYREKCVGCNTCVQLAPDYWTISKADGKAYLLFSEKRKKAYIRDLPPEDREKNMLAARDCPARIIKVE